MEQVRLGSLRKGGCGFPIGRQEDSRGRRYAWVWRGVLPADRSRSYLPPALVLRCFSAAPLQARHSALVERKGRWPRPELRCSLTLVVDVLIAMNPYSRSDSEYTSDESFSFPRMVGDCPAYLEALGRLMEAARSDRPVLLDGERGTGKELAAHFIHRHSARRSMPFRAIDCAALSPALFELEVSGTEGAACSGGPGRRLEQPSGGTLYLSRVDEMPQVHEAKLLRMLGGEGTDARLICSTDRAPHSGSPSDLLKCSACVTILLPSLSERRSDIPLLASELLRRIGRALGRSYHIDGAAVELLLHYDYPGNVEALRNVLWIAATNAEDGHITSSRIVDALPLVTRKRRFARARSAFAAALAPDIVSPPHPAPVRRPTDAQALTLALQLHRGNRRAAARELGVTERTVYRKIRQYGLSGSGRG